MLEFLKNVDIDDKVIQEMYSKHDDALIFNLKANATNCLGIIMFMKKVKIEVIDELLLNRPEWFLMTIDSFIEKFTPGMVKQINEDYYSVNL